MSEAIITREHAGLFIEYVQDEYFFDINPMTSQDNAGRILSWTPDFDGDERIRQPDDFGVTCKACGGYGRIEDNNCLECPTCNGTGEVPSDAARYFAEHYDAALTLPLYFADYRSNGATIYVSDDANCALVFTAEEIEREWNGSVDDATRYAEARINELDSYLQGYVFGIVVRADDAGEPGEVLESAWGFIGDVFDRKTREWADSEADSMAEYCRDEIDRERAESERWACADVETVR